jgi:hypothetical protein
MSDSTRPIVEAGVLTAPEFTSLKLEEQAEVEQPLVTSLSDTKRNRCAAFYPCASLDSELIAVRSASARTE